MKRSPEAEEMRGEILRADEIFNQQNKPMTSEETFKSIGQIRLMLETATRLRDWELAQALCIDLAHQYSLLKLEVKQQEQEK